MQRHPPELQSTSLLLKIIDQSHLQDVFQTMNCQETAETLSFLTWPITMNHARAWVETSIEGIRTGKFLFIAYHKETEEPAGCICAVPWKDDSSKTEIGYWVSERWKGKGIATEMIGAAVKFAFGTLKTASVIATIAADNAASLAATRQFGFQATGEMVKPTAKGTDLKLTIYELFNPEPID